MSLRTLELIRKRLEERPAELDHARKNGAKVVGWLNYNVPEEIIHALGLVPVRLGTGGDDRLVELGSRYISTMNCVYFRQVVGLFAERRDPYIRSADLVVVDATCKQMFRLAEVLPYYFKVPTRVLGVPHSAHTREGKIYFRKEVAAFARGLEQLAGRALEPRKLEASVKLYSEIRSTIQALYRQQASAAEPIGWREVYEAVQAGYHLDRDEYLGLLRALLAEVVAAPARKGAERPRLLLAGSVIPPGDRKLLDIIDQAGGRIVVDDLWSGFAPSVAVTVREPTLDGLADAYLVPHASLPYLDLATDERLGRLKRLVSAYQAEGVVYHSLRYCDSVTFKASETKRVLHEAGVPFLEIHSEYAGSDTEAMRTRVEAFIELLRTRTRAAA